MSDKNIDKDIENIKSFVRSIRSDLEEDAPDNFKLAKSIENVLSELKIKDKMIDKMAEDIKEADEYLSSELNFIGYENNSIEEIKEDYRKMVEKVD